jgi:cell division septation protein DedD
VSIHYNKQSQFELFPGAVGNSAEIKKTGFFRTSLIVSLDNLVVVGIVAIMLLVVAFSFGVERGKYVVRLREYNAKLKTLSSLAFQPPALPQPVAARPAAVILTASPVSFSRVAQPLSVNVRPALRQVQNPSARPTNFPALTPQKITPATTRISVPVRKPAVAPQPAGIPKIITNQPRVPVQKVQIVKAGLTLPVGEVLQAVAPSAKAASPKIVPVTIRPLEKKVDKSYTVQVASYLNAGEANRAVADLRRRGMEAVLMPKGKYTILCVGNFSAKNEAESASKNLKRQFKDCAIRSL